MQNWRSKLNYYGIDEEEGVDEYYAETPPAIKGPLSRYRYLNHVYGPTRTQQSELDQTDVNQIVERFKRTGQLPVRLDGMPAQYGDVTGLQHDYATLINRSREALEIANDFAAAWKPPQSPVVENNGEPAPTPAPAASAAPSP